MWLLLFDDTTVAYDALCGLQVMARWKEGGVVGRGAFLPDWFSSSVFVLFLCSCVIIDCTLSDAFAYGKLAEAR